jgi:hypothetical protein
MCLIVVMSHQLTDDQVNDAKASLGVNEVVQLVTDNALQARTIPASMSFRDVEMLANEIVTDAENQGATHFSIMGEPALVCSAMINAHHRDLTCVQSTTERVSQDLPQPDGTVKKVSVFKHVQWRVWL